MNRITIIGNLTRDPETGTTDGGINWCRFSVAVNGRKRGDSPAPVEYFEVTAWRALADRNLLKDSALCLRSHPKDMIGQKLKSHIVVCSTVIWLQLWKAGCSSRMANGTDCTMKILNGIIFSGMYQMMLICSM